MGRRALALAAVLLLGGCYRAEAPVDATPLLERDPALLGTWRCLGADASPADTVATFVVEPLREREYGMLFTAPGDRPQRYEARFSDTPAGRLLNVRELDAGSEPWVLARVTLLRPRVLHVELLSEKLLEGVAPEALRTALGQHRERPELWEAFVVCVQPR